MLYAGFGTGDTLAAAIIIPAFTSIYLYRSDNVYVWRSWEPLTGGMAAWEVWVPRIPEAGALSHPVQHPEGLDEVHPLSFLSGLRGLHPHRLRHNGAKGLQHILCGT